MKPFLTEKDIIEQVAEEMGYPLKAVHLVWKYLLLEMGRMTLEPDCNAIYLPYLGTIYEKMGMLKYYSKLYSLKKNPAVGMTRVEKVRQERMKNLEEAVKKTGVYFSPHNIRVTNTNHYYVGTMTYAEQETLQNTKWEEVRLEHLHPVQSTMPYGKIFKPMTAADCLPKRKKK
jgi:hypothetical protein